MNKSLNIVIAGLGTVGSGTIQLIEKNKSLIKLRSGLDINIIGISGKSRNKKRSFNVKKYNWFDNPLKMLQLKDLDVVVELIGGEKGIAKRICFESLKKKKNLITANKSLIASKGYELAKIAETNDLFLGYEASVAGGIPIILNLKKSLSGVKIKKMIGILNGTCNYILTNMMEKNINLNDALKNAQKLGYAERLYDNDLNGLDTLHKICILSSIAFGAKINFEQIKFQGIKSITKKDIIFSKDLGYVIKLLGICYEKDGKLNLSVNPFLISKNKELSSVSKNLNAIITETVDGNKTILVGEGAGGKATAISVLSDLINLTNNKKNNVFGLPINKLKKIKIDNQIQSKSMFYIRALVYDRPGAIASITTILKNYRISIKSLFQKQLNKKFFDVIILTHSIDDKVVRKASKKLNKSIFLKENSKILQVLHI